jgi:hypothetical protein
MVGAVGGVAKLFGDLIKSSANCPVEQFSSVARSMASCKRPFVIASLSFSMFSLMMLKLEARLTAVIYMELKDDALRADLNPYTRFYLL